MILNMDNDDGKIKIGSPPEELPGIVESVMISASLLVEKKEMQGRSGKTKVVQGWDDAALTITLSLIDAPAAGSTRWDFLKYLTGVFKKVTDKGEPEVYTLAHPMINAWRATRFLFSSLDTAEHRSRRMITATLDFVEYESFASVVQERQPPPARSVSPAPTTPPVSDEQRLGLDKQGARFG